MSTLIAHPVNKEEPSPQGAAECLSDPRIIRRVETVCELFEMAYEIKSLELKRRHPYSTEQWIHTETLRLIEAGTR